MGLRFYPQFSRSNKLNAPQISSSRPSRNSYARIARNRLQRVASDPKLLRPHAYPFIVFMFFSLFNSQPTNNPSSPDRIIKSQVPWEREKKQPTDRPSKKTGEKLGEVVTLSQRAKASLDTTHFFFSSVSTGFFYFVPGLITIGDFRQKEKFHRDKVTRGNGASSFSISVTMWNWLKEQIVCI